MKHKMLVIVGLVVIGSISTLQAAAKFSPATHTVTNNADSGNGTLRATLFTANAGDRIIFNLGTKNTITFNSELKIDKDITIDGAGKVILDGGNSGNGATNGTYILVIAENKTVTLSNLTIQHGYDSVLWSAGTLTINNSVFRENISSCHAGAIVCYNGGALTVNNSIFNGNIASGYGGVILCTKDCTLTINNSTFCGNTAESWGGAIYCEGLLKVNNSTFTKNSAASCGAIYCTSASVVNNSIFSENEARSDEYGYGGGAIKTYNDPLSDNYGPLTVNNSTFSGNSARIGGAIYCFGDTDNTIKNSIFIGNTAREIGGAIYCADLNASLAVRDSVFTGNAAKNGGAIYCEETGKINLANNLISENGTNSITRACKTVYRKTDSKEYEDCVVVITNLVEIVQGGNAANVANGKPEELKADSIKSQTNR